MQKGSVNVHRKLRWGDRDYATSTETCAREKLGKSKPFISRLERHTLKAHDQKRFQDEISNRVQVVSRYISISSWDGNFLSILRK